MRGKRAAAVATGVAMVAAVTWSGRGEAQEPRGPMPALAPLPAPPPEPPPPPPAVESTPASEPTSAAAPSSAADPTLEPILPLPPRPRTLSLGVNPLAFLLGRFGGDVEYLFAKYFALVGNLHLDGSLAITSASKTPYWGFGGEAGVRFYPGEGSLFGFFLGPSLVAGYYNVNYYGYAFPLPDVGFAFDLGGKLHVGDRGFIALGAGFQYTNTPRYPNDFDSIVSFVIGSGIVPRLLLTAGSTFR